MPSPQTTRTAERAVVALLATLLCLLPTHTGASSCWVDYNAGDGALVDSMNDLLAKVQNGAGGTDHLRGYSAHSCMGSFYSNRACKFTNLYYNRATHALEYYVCEDEPVRNVLMGHEHMYENFTVSHSYGDKHLATSFMRRTLGDKKDDLHKIVKIRGALPHEDDVMDFSGSTAMLWPGVMHFRYGHVWVDNLYPMFMHLMNFDEVEDDFTVFLMYKNTTIFADYLISLTNKPVEMLDKYGSESGKQWVRFRSATVPSREYRLSNVPDNHDSSPIPTLSYSTVWWHFRSHTYKAMGVKGHIRPRKHKIVLNVGLGKRSISNVEETMICIKENFPEAEVQAVTFHALPFEQQLQVLAETTVFITTEGSPGFRMIFLPRGSSVILLGSPTFEKSSRARNAPFHESDRWLDWITYIDLQRYPVSIGNRDEYVFRYDRSKHEKLSDKQVHDESYWYLWKVYDADIVVMCEKLIPLLAQALMDTTMALMNRM